MSTEHVAYLKIERDAARAEIDRLRAELDKLKGRLADTEEIMRRSAEAQEIRCFQYRDEVAALREALHGVTGSWSLGNAIRVAEQALAVVHAPATPRFQPNAVAGPVGVDANGSPVTP